MSGTFKSYVGLVRLKMNLLRAGIPLLRFNLRLKSRNFSSKETKNDNIKIFYPAPVVYWKKILDFMESHFVDEPLFRMFNVKLTPEVLRDKHESISETLRNNISTIAIECPSGKIVGVLLNGVLYEKDLNKCPHFHNEKVQMIYKIIIEANKECDLFNKYKVDEIFECRFLAVHKDYRGQGIAMKLACRTEEEAKKAGFKLIKTEATSTFTYKIFNKLKHEVILEKLYTDLLSHDKTGMWIELTPEHTHFRLMIKDYN